MEWFEIISEDGKWRTVYTKENDKYYRQHFTFWNKGGYFLPQARKRTTAAEYARMKEYHSQMKGEDHGKDEF